MIQPARALRHEPLAVRDRRDGEQDQPKPPPTSMVAVGPSSPARACLDEHQIARIGDRGEQRDRIAVTDAAGGQHARHHPGTDERDRQRRPDARRRPLAEEQRAADDGEHRRDIADERGVGDLCAAQRNVERADVDREGDA